MTVEISPLEADVLLGVLDEWYGEGFCSDPKYLDRVYAIRVKLESIAPPL